ncbi:hypothetical protein GUITHDRAFT_119940 [Guillardia theta CCMP2712]|uniref:Uncharacterized protein n=1 Tax=Guillardia theta (strain CCMP2712) TaxID=905079 RepID=L1IDJ3_GUITC|nr:hypothetical protein GUITHDRAFT_119940 [Guillardia theta CCMP2712]EKX33895.1 hypothetical protein GUITHDRAFT_119940 [Guillardia theta CCMP2712]|eukprot:XP_005820875.1 hypothetical protein GUITHDRAFT_119940 [Guillardia theta CCMP2712]
MSEDGRLQDPILRLERVCPAAVRGEDITLLIGQRSASMHMAREDAHDKRGHCIGFTGRRHTVHSEKLHKHTQNTSPKRTSTAGTQTRHRQPKREAAQTSSLRVRQSSAPLDVFPPSESETSGEDSPSGDSTKSEEELSSGSRSACARKGVMRLAPDKSASSVSSVVRR